MVFLWPADFFITHRQPIWCNFASLQCILVDNVTKQQFFFTKSACPCILRWNATIRVLHTNQPSIVSNGIFRIRFYEGRTKTNNEKTKKFEIFFKMWNKTLLFLSNYSIALRTKSKKRKIREHEGQRWPLKQWKLFLKLVTPVRHSVFIVLNVLILL